jgi:hypothetical protein
MKNYQQNPVKRLLKIIKNGDEKAALQIWS